MMCADPQGVVQNKGNPWLAADSLQLGREAPASIRKAPFGLDHRPGQRPYPCTNFEPWASSDVKLSSLSLKERIKIRKVYFRRNMYVIVKYKWKSVNSQSSQFIIWSLVYATFLTFHIFLKGVILMCYRLRAFIYPILQQKSYIPYYYYIAGWRSFSGCQRYIL